MSPRAKVSALRVDDAQVGDKILFASEKQRYTVQAKGGHFLVCTKPYNLLKTVMYCIVDLKERVRGPENLIFGMGAETREGCEEMIARLTRVGSDEYGNDATEVSYRHRVDLDVVRVDRSAPSNPKAVA